MADTADSSGGDPRQATGNAGLLTEPDIDPLRRLRRHTSRHAAGVVAAVAVGGMAGAAARYVLLRQWPPGPDEFPVTTLVVNVVGCAVMGLFMVATDKGTRHRLLRPFFGTGVLGGFTTFSTFSGELEQLVSRGDARLAMAYLVVTMVATLVAVAAGAALARRVFS